MKTFIDQILDDLNRKEINSTMCTFVVPSRRVRLFLNNAIAKRLDVPSFAPAIYSIEDFVAHLSGMRIVPDLEILPLFYEAYLTVEQKNADSYDEFLSWAITILADFNEIDRYLVNTDSFFSFLGNVKELDSNHWSLEHNPTQIVSKYLRFWKKLHLYYNALQVKCIAAGVGYQGMVYRDAFAKADSQKAMFSAQTPIVFLGLNATNTAESNIIQSYLSEGIAHIYWDTDAHFIDSTYHEAGKFIRQYIKEWKAFEKNVPQFINSDYTAAKHIAIQGATGNLGMTQAMAHVLSQLPIEEQEQTAVILADEALLLPVLHAIPDSINRINVTMGVSIDKTPMASFINDIFKLHLQAGEQGFYFKNLIRILESPFMTLLLPFAQKIIQEIHKANTVYIKNSSAFKSVHGMVDLLLTPIAGNQQFLMLLDEVLCRLRAKLIVKRSGIELEQLLGITALVNELSAIQARTPELRQLVTLHFLYRQLLPLKRLDFIGEPVRGLQVMGLLETRALEFKNIIMLSVNEGVLPAGKTANSYVPYDMKIKFAMPTYSDKDSVYAYHFYRLLHRCEHATFIYNTEPDTLGGGERSRFLMQIQAQALPKHIITTNQYITATAAVNLQPLSIRKTDAYFKRLAAINDKGFSPSALTSYVRNPIQFFENKIMRIQEQQEVEENIALNTMGSIIHETLDKAYKPFCKEPLTVAVLKIIKQSVSALLETAYQKIYKSLQEPVGKNKIIYEVSRHYVNKMVEADLDIVNEGHELIIHETEKELTGKLTIPKLGVINFIGNVDRIDSLNGQLRIIDYKTGRTEPKNLSLNPDDYSELLTNYDKSKAFQVLMYAYMYNQLQPAQELAAGIISFKNFSSGFISFAHKVSNRNQPQSITIEILNTFEQQLIELISELYNPAIPLLEKEV
jgi:hypothetical protein